MAGFRAYFDFSDSSPNGGTIQLSPEESRHLCGSLRAKAGDRVDAFDLCGNVKQCELIDPNPKKALLKIVEPIFVPPQNTEIFIAQCMPKGKVFDDIIRQSVEIGAAGIFPLMSERSQVKIEESEKSKKIGKWRVHIAEAVKQSANFFGFKIGEPKSIKDFLASDAPKFDLKIVASLQSGSKPIIEILKAAQSPKRVCILIGPEGDMSENEYAAASEAGFLPATLGKNVMKCDTAAIFALSAAAAYLQ